MQVKVNRKLAEKIIEREEKHQRKKAQRILAKGGDEDVVDIPAPAVSAPDNEEEEKVPSAEEKKQREDGQPTWRKRQGYGMAAAAMLPAIFVQVPSGLAVSGSLVAGITSADEIISNTTGTTTVSSGSDNFATNGAAFTVSLSVIQIAIGITVGLFISAIVVYPMGKRRSGLFAF